METIRKLREKIINLEWRIRELENHICPFESHEWVQVGFSWDTSCNGMCIDTINHYRCSRCGKKKGVWC